MQKKNVRKLSPGAARQNRIGWLFVLPELAGVLVFYALPFADVVRRSFLQAAGNRFVGWENYRQVLHNRAFLLAAKNTLCFVVVCLPLLLSLSLFVALLLQREKIGRQFFKGALLIPLAMPAASVVLLWKLLFDARGFVNAFFGAKIDWMNTGAAFGVLVFSYIWKNLGYDVILWTAALSAIPKSLYEAAGIDGAGPWDCFWHITLPNIRPAAFTIVVLSLLNSFKVFREAYLVAGSYPQESIYLLQHVFNNWFQELSTDKLSAGSVLLFLVITALVILLQKSWDEEEKV